MYDQTACSIQRISKPRPPIFPVATTKFGNPLYNIIAPKAHFQSG